MRCDEMKLRILYRQVFDITPNLFSEFLKLEEEMLYAEEKHGYPAARKYRPLASYKDCGSRIYERVFESIADFSRLISKRYLDKNFAKLDARRFKLVNWARNELYYVDSGSPVSAWMQGISSQPFSVRIGGAPAPTLTESHFPGRVVATHLWFPQWSRSGDSAIHI